LIFAIMGTWMRDPTVPHEDQLADASDRELSQDIPL
jgi:hypothetical protein